jgi:NAD(P)-dependent dehydrogenase (short-subunit alcohol dehydrogenase family)
MKGIVLITGGSRGIGAATAILAAKEGFQVGVNYKSNQTAAIEVVDFIRKNGGKAFSHQADVSSESDVVSMFAAIDQMGGGLKGLVNNSGILGKQMRVEEMPLERVRHVMTQNFLGSFLCSKEAVLRMSSQYGGAGGSIVNVSSLASRTGAPGEYVDYAASKGALDAFTLGLAKEVAEFGIRVNAVRPAFIYTDIHADGGEPGRVNRVSPSIPMKRGGNPEEVAEAIVWLLSDKASYCTGSFIDLAGGK